MILHNPFFIGSTLSPALKIGDSVLHLVGTEYEIESNRDVAQFLLETPEFDYSDSEMRSGVGGFHSTVDIFESFLSFLAAAAERAEYEVRTGLSDGDGLMFPAKVTEWALLNKDEIDMASSSICDDFGNAVTSLIEE